MSDFTIKEAIRVARIINDGLESRHLDLSEYRRGFEGALKVIEILMELKTDSLTTKEKRK